jgi:hypothetical protein
MDFLPKGCFCSKDNVVLLYFTPDAELRIRPGESTGLPILKDRARTQNTKFTAMCRLMAD